MTETYNVPASHLAIGDVIEIPAQARVETIRPSRNRRSFNFDVRVLATGELLSLHSSAGEPWPIVWGLPREVNA